MKSPKDTPSLTDLAQPDPHWISPEGHPQAVAEATRHWRSVAADLLFLLSLALLVTAPFVSLADNQLSVQVQHP
jgi:hypothetical protein